MSISHYYPQAPAEAPASLTEPSASFRAQVRNVVMMILAFVVTYLVLVTLAFVLAYLCVITGLFLLQLKLHWLSILLAIGVVLMGFLVVFFLIKFLFASSETDTGKGIILEEADEPELFEFIRRTADEVGTHFPRRVILIPDVNASVFYDSSFLSLFFPTRKNLNIGLGLVNALNVSEFKAVLAHEFGHFSQKSMSLGSYVYYVNQVIFNMLYRNDGWVGAANTIASIHEMLGFFVHLAVQIVRGVQWVLRTMYMLLNKQYKKLSREMEFHADAISARFSGSNNMAQALRQVDIGSDTYQQTLNKCNDLLRTKQAPLNFYTGQRVVAAHFASVHELPYQAGAPVVTQAFIQHRTKERVNFKDQWASHPTQEEREKSLEKISLNLPIVQESAWVVFQQATRWQQEMTNIIYREIGTQLDWLSDESFSAAIVEEQQAMAFPKLYQGFYDAHILFTENWEKVVDDTVATGLTKERVAELVADNLDQKIGMLQNDIATLAAIAEGQVDTKSFDFDGQKYEKSQAEKIRHRLEKELKQSVLDRNERDTALAAAFYGHALSLGLATADTLKKAYRAMHLIRGSRDTFMTHGHEIMVTIHLLERNEYMLATDDAKRFKALHQEHEPQLRLFFNSFYRLNEMPETMQKVVQEVFLGDPVVYHHHNNPHQTNLEKLREAIVMVGEWLEKEMFDQQKAVLVLQAQLIRA